MQRLLGAISVGLVFLLGAIPQLPMSDDYKSIANVVVGLVSTMLGAYLAPVVTNVVKGVFKK